MGYDSASVMSSELESSSFVDSDEDEDASRLMKRSFTDTRLFIFHLSNNVNAI